jgi:hypothetical protein
MTKIRNKTESKRKRKKTILEKKMKFVFFFQTSNLHLIKQKNIFIIKHIRKTRIFFGKENRN